MASFLYDECRNSIGGIPTHSVIDFNDDTIKCFFVDEADDAPNQTTDVDAADRSAAAQVPDYASAVDVAMTAAISSNVLVLDGTDAVFTALNDDPVESYDLFKDSGVEATSPLIGNFDDATGLPLDPSGGNVTIVWAATGIIRI
jgi:hypothetical protein